MVSIAEVILLVVTAFLPAIIYVIWIRNTEKIRRQSWKSIAMAFLWGASVAIIGSLILEIYLGGRLQVSVQNDSLRALLSVIVIAPFAEEIFKSLALGLKSVKNHIHELEDGLIYGATAGLGFSATENLFYGAGFLPEGLLLFTILIIMRSIGACLLHASATAVTGYGYSKLRLGGKSLVRVIPYLFVAMFLHGLYNFFASYESIGLALGLIFAFGTSLISIYIIRRKITYLDKYISK